MNRKSLSLLFAACAAAGPILAAEPATVSVTKLKDLNIRFYGFLETDIITDSRQGFSEVQGETLIPRPTLASGADSFAGKHGRTQLSVRDSRLGLDLTLPKSESGLQAEGILEMDFLGNDATNTLPGTTGGSQTERDFFNNPAIRLRHAYANITDGTWNAKLGQTWSLFGWQPYYFPAEPAVPPTPGMLFQRFTQARVTQAQPMGDWLLETAADVSRPAEMNSALPEAHAGLRFSSTKTKAAASAGSTATMPGLSAAVSGAWLPVRTDRGNANGEAVALDVFIPILPSKDGLDRSNNLSIAGEFMTGEGVGAVEVPGLTFGVPATTTTGTALDAGLAGINSDGNVELLRFRAFRAHVQYTLPCPQWTVSVGYAQIEALNLDHFSNALNNNGNGVGFVPAIRYGYASLFWDPLPWFRAAGEFSQTVDTYNDPNNRHAYNNRFQINTFFLF